METKMMPVLEPDFYKDFHCAAAGCRNSCCVFPWEIIVSKKYYKELRARKEPKWLTEHFGDYFMRNPSSSSPIAYALVRLGPNGCKMQTAEGLCRMQVDLGAECLSSICREYPRQTTYFLAKNVEASQLQRGLTPSCEEVSRMLFQKPEPIRFVTKEEPYHPARFATEHPYFTNMLVNDGTRPLRAHYRLIQLVSIALLQNRVYPIEHRLMMLLLYLDKVAKAEEASKENEVPAISASFVQAVEEGVYDGLLTASGGAISGIQLSNIAAVTVFSSKADDPIVARCNDGITTLSSQTRLDSYRAFMENKAHFIEHLLVMEFYNKAMPFTKDRSIFDCAQYMVSVFTIFRFMLGAYLGETHDLTEIEFVDFVAFFGKTALHSLTSFDRNITLLKDNEMDTLPNLMSILLG